VIRAETLTFILALFLFLAEPFYRKFTGSTSLKKAKKFLFILGCLFLLIFLSLWSFPRINSYLDGKGYIVQSPVILRSPFQKRVHGAVGVNKRLPFEPPPQAGGKKACDADYCGSFEFQNEEWDGWPQFRQSTKYVRAVIPSLEGGVFDTARLWYKEFQPPPEFKAELVFKPYQSEFGNVVVSYGTIWRCIIAEDNYNTVSCEAEKPLKDRQSGHFTGKKKKQVQPETDVLLALETILTGEKKVKIIIKVGYVDIDGNESSADFDFTISMPTPKPAEENQYIGVGIIDPKRRDPAVEFRHFKLWKK